ncbi:MAG: hypothetical protein AAB582_03800 [Patescibacteria group bacterium]
MFFLWAIVAALLGMLTAGLGQLKSWWKVMSLIPLLVLMFLMDVIFRRSAGPWDGEIFAAAAIGGCLFFLVMRYWRSGRSTKASEWTGPTHYLGGGSLRNSNSRDFER